MVRAEIGTVRAQMETIRAEIRAAIAEAGNELFARVNGNYVKRELCKSVAQGLADRIDRIEERIEGHRCGGTS